MLRTIIYRYPALGHALYRRYFSASLASVGATQLITFGQLWLVYDLTSSAVMLGWLGACTALPNLVITLFGGVIADRYNKRIIIAVTSSGNMLLAAIFTLLVLFDVVEVWHVLVIAATSSLLNGFDWPTRVAIFPQLVDQSSYLSAVALNSFIWQVTRLGIPALGGFLLYYTGLASLAGLATLGHLTMCAMMVLTPMPRGPSSDTSTGTLRQMGEAVTFIFRNDLFKYLLFLTFVGMFFCNAHAQLMPVFAEQTSSGEIGLGLLMGAGGLGSMIGTIVIGGNRNVSNVKQMMFISGLLTALLTVLFAVSALMGLLVLALLTQFAAAFVASLFLITSMTTMQLNVPGQLRGRVMGVHTMCYSLLPLGGVFLGNLTDMANSVTAISVGSAVYMATLILCFHVAVGLRTSLGSAESISNPVK